MRKLFIADDEASIRDGIKLLVDWEELGYKVCGEAGNGNDAIIKILETKPDVALLDIKMPGLSGLEVIEQARNANLNCQFIILSGYSDFKFAQVAMRLGVYRYLTKPIDEDELTALIQEINGLLDKENSNKTKEAFLSRKSQKEVLQNIIAGNIDLDMVDAELLEIKADCYQIIAYENFKMDEAELPYQFSELFNAVGGQENNRKPLFIAFEYKHRNLLLLLGNMALSRFKRFLEHYERSVEKGSPLDSLFIAYSEPVESLDQLKTAYDNTIELLKHRFFCVAGQHVLSADDLPTVRATAEPTYEIDDDKIRSFSFEIVNYIQSFNRRKVAESLYALEEYFYDINLDNDKIKLFLVDAYLQIKDMMQHHYSGQQLNFYTNSEIIAYIQNTHYLYEIFTLFSKQFEEVMTQLGNSTRDSVMDDIFYYIEHNYQANIKLETIASLFGYNSSYLGKVFTKTAGENFNSYIDKVRIKYATEFLKETDMKVYEISEKVGYRNVDYFHKKFKKITGESPVEYKKRYE